MVSRATMEARIRDADWLRDDELQAIFALLDGETARTRAVGGIVRDTLLGVARENADIDLATEILPRDVMARAQNSGIAAYPTGIEHGTITLRLGTLVTEVTTLRQDIDTDGRHAVVKFGTDWRRDAERRDFTINALYADMHGALFDPLGGAPDLAEPRIRFIGDPDRRIAEDLLRVYRFFRFSASHGGEKLNPQGLAAAKRAVPMLGSLAAERVGMEMRRMLGLPRIAATLGVMTRAGILSFGEKTLDRLKSYGLQTRRAGFAARLAIVLADTDAKQVQTMWRFSNDEMAEAGAILSAARFLGDFRLNEAAYRFPSVLADGVEVAAVLAGWTEAGKSAVLDQLQDLSPPAFPITGNDLIAAGIEPGPALGAELDRLERAWIESSFALERPQLLAMARR